MIEETIPTYQVKAGSFEGPLELLLSLIENRKFFVNEISLAEVTNDYIGYIKSITNVSNDKHIADVSYFILIASTLILIKSKSLLPNLELTEDENEKITDLEQRLKLYQIIKNASIDFLNTDLTTLNYELIVADCWCAVYEATNHTIPHSHFPSDFSAVIYLEMVEESAPIIFNESLVINPASGTVIFFPGSLPHHVPATKGKRVIVAINYIKIPSVNQG